MRKPNRLSLVFAVLIAAALACNLPNSQTATPAPNAAYTAAAQTVAAELTQAAQVQPTATAIPPTDTQAPTNTAPAVTIAPPPTLILPTAATSGCDSALFVADVTVNDNTVMTPGQTFTKTWRLKNNGSCSWTPSYAVTFVSGDQMSGPASQALVGNVNPGDTVDISVNLTAPSQNGTYTGYWKLRNASGATFPSSFYVQIVVSSGSSGGGTSGPFAVTSVTYTLSYWSDTSYTHCPRIVAHMTTNGPGTITYYWKRSDGASSTDETVSVPSAGTFNVRYDWSRGSTWAGTPAWVGLYVDNPNHQDFGHFSFSAACTSP